MDKAGGAAQTAQKSAMNAGQTIQKTAVGAVDAVKNATGMGKWFMIDQGFADLNSLYKYFEAFCV